MDIITAAAVILALLFTSAFFSGGELAMMALNEINLETDVRRGKPVAKLQKYLRSRPQRFLSTILIGYNVANIALATYGAGLAHRYLAPMPQFSEESALAISALVMTVLILIFAELMPKTIAAIMVQPVANWVAYPLYLIDFLLTPLNWVIEKLVMPMIYAMTGGKKFASTQMGREELLTALVLAHRGGKMRHEDMAVAMEAIDLSSHKLSEVQTPRVDVVAIHENTGKSDAIKLMLESGYSRLPVYKRDIDQISGVVLLKDLVKSGLNGDEANITPSGPVKDLVRPVAHYPCTKSIVDTLSDLQKRQVHMAVVVDEHGGTSGIVSMEDILEELVGEIDDESDVIRGDIIRDEGGATIVSGRVRLDQVPMLRDLELVSTSSTLGGVMMDQLGRPVIPGDAITLGDVQVTALKVVRNQVKMLRLEKSRSAEDEWNPS